MQLDDTSNLVINNYNNVDLGFHNSYDSPTAFKEEIETFVSMIPESGSILNIGGTFSECSYFTNNGFHVTNIDISEKMLESVLQGSPKTKVKNLNIKNEAAGKFDGIWACRSLFHIEPKAINKTITNIRESLNPNGVFCIVIFPSNSDKIEENYIQDNNSRNNGVPTTYYRATYPTNVFRTKLEATGLNLISIIENKDQDMDRTVAYIGRRS